MGISTLRELKWVLIERAVQAVFLASALVVGSVTSAYVIVRWLL